VGVYELTVESVFAAAHQLRMYDGRLEPLHGHNWRVEAFYESAELDGIGVAADFALLQSHVGRAVAQLHDRFLNELPMFVECNPSAEHVARWLHGELSRAAPPGVRVRRVRVWESPGCAAAYAD